MFDDVVEYNYLFNTKRLFFFLCKAMGFLGIIFCGCYFNEEVALKTGWTIYMDEEGNNTYIFEGPNDFINFLLEDGGEAMNEVKKRIPPISNLCTLRKALEVKPCKCGGQDPKQVMKRRMGALDSFYEKLMVALSNNFYDKFEGDPKAFMKEIILKNANGVERVSFKLKGETLLEI